VTRLETPVRVASIGTGRWAGTLSDAARKDTGLAVVACTSRSAERREAFASRYGCRGVATFEAVLADPDIEGVIITTPHSLHAGQIVAAAAAGKHVFVDKPFTLTVADARRATEACRKADVVLALGHQRRRTPASRALRRMLDDGTLGRLAQVEGNFSADYAFASTITADMWRADRAETPGGAMTNLGIHHVDTYQYLFGPVARVMALSRRLVLDIDVEDVTSILFEFASGVLGYLGTSWLPATRTEWLGVHGTGAQAWYEGPGTKLWLQRRGEPERTPVPLTPVDPLVEELTDFARCVREHARPEVGGEEGIATIAVLEAIVESARTGRAADVPGRSNGKDAL
jgi:predicted dehydrogenase